jgi:hypothetical protein
VGSLNQRLAYRSSSLPNLSIIFPNFSHNTSYVTWTTPSFKCMHPLICVHTSIDSMGIYLLRCAHGNERTKTSYVIHDTFVATARDAGFPRGTNIITCTSFNHNQLFLSMSRHCVYQKWHSYLSRCCHS